MYLFDLLSISTAATKSLQLSQASLQFQQQSIYVANLFWITFATFCVYTTFTIPNCSFSYAQKLQIVWHIKILERWWLEVLAFGNSFLPTKIIYSGIAAPEFHCCKKATQQVGTASTVTIVLTCINQKWGVSYKIPYLRIYSQTNLAVNILGLLYTWPSICVDHLPFSSPL